MSGESATKDVQVSLGKGFVIIGSGRIEVSPDGKKVTAYTNDGVETTAASGEAPAQGISISADLNTVVLNGAIIEHAADGHLVISTSGTVITKPGPANDTAAITPQEIGAIESTGNHKSEIYGGIWSREYGGDNLPIWFSAPPKLMDHYEAAAWAEKQGGALPTKKQGGYLTTLRGKGGGFTEIFNRGGSFPSGFVWLAEHVPGYRGSAWCQRLNDGHQKSYITRYAKLPVLCVRG